MIRRANAHHGEIGGDYRNAVCDDPFHGSFVIGEHADGFSEFVTGDHALLHDNHELVVVYDEISGIGKDIRVIDGMINIAAHVVRFAKLGKSLNGDGRMKTV